jgi:hypothetical protein
MSSVVLILGAGARSSGLGVLADSLHAAGFRAWHGELWSLPRSNQLAGAPWVGEPELLRALESSEGEEFSVQNRVTRAQLTQVHLVVLVLPAAPSDWATLGALWALRSSTSLRLAVLITAAGEDRPAGLHGVQDLPLAAGAASLVTTDPDRIVAWCQGRLFARLAAKPTKGLEQEPGD